MANIKDYSLSKLADFLAFAYDREMYERWLTLYPHMEMGIIEYISFEDYKKKLKENITTSQKQKSLTDKQIISEMESVVKLYEKRKGRW